MSYLGDVGEDGRFLRTLARLALNSGPLYRISVFGDEDGIAKRACFPLTKQPR
jgi:hypothetical protein